MSDDTRRILDMLRAGHSHDEVAQTVEVSARTISRVVEGLRSQLRALRSAEQMAED